MGGPGLASSAEPEMEKGETARCGMGPTTCADRPGDSDISTASTWTSKLITLLNDSAELANDMCEHTEGGRDKTGTLGWPSVTIMVCG